MQDESLFCTAVKQAKRLTKRINKNPTYDSDDEKDDLVREEPKEKCASNPGFSLCRCFQLFTSLLENN